MGPFPDLDGADYRPFCPHRPAISKEADEEMVRHPELWLALVFHPQSGYNLPATRYCRADRAPGRTLIRPKRTQDSYSKSQSAPTTTPKKLVKVQGKHSSARKSYLGTRGYN